MTTENHSPAHSPMKSNFKGNKQALPSKLCAVCNRTMTWRKAWARNWESVLYCSDACRTHKAQKSTAPMHIKS